MVSLLTMLRQCGVAKTLMGHQLRSSFLTDLCCLLDVRDPTNRHADSSSWQRFKQFLLDKVVPRTYLLFKDRSMQDPGEILQLLFDPTKVTHTGYLALRNALGVTSFKTFTCKSPYCGRSSISRGDFQSVYAVQLPEAPTTAISFEELLKLASLSTYDKDRECPYCFARGSDCVEKPLGHGNCLIIQIQRVNNVRKKIARKVTLTEGIRYKIGAYEYFEVGKVFHTGVGDEIESGHFTAEILDPDTGLRLFLNDATVHEISPGGRRKRSGVYYVLLQKTVCVWYCEFSNHNVTQGTQGSTSPAPPPRVTSRVSERSAPWGRRHTQPPRSSHGAAVTSASRPATTTGGSHRTRGTHHRSSRATGTRKKSKVRIFRCFIVVGLILLLFQSRMSAKNAVREATSGGMLVTDPLAKLIAQVNVYIVVYSFSLLSRHSEITGIQVSISHSQCAWMAVVNSTCRQWVHSNIRQRRQSSGSLARTKSLMCPVIVWFVW